MLRYCYGIATVLVGTWTPPLKTPFLAHLLAVAMARRVARQGETVLFSPMTASFDMFDNFEHRGRVFKEIVSKL